MVSQQFPVRGKYSSLNWIFYSGIVYGFLRFPEEFIFMEVRPSKVTVKSHRQKFYRKKFDHENWDMVFLFLSILVFSLFNFPGKVSLE
jgi:hypothetical protein